jgi:hypothetical protein
VVPPVLLDLCTVAILHRFSSPTWWQHLIQHVPTDFSQSDAFDKIVRLQVSYSDVRDIPVSQKFLDRASDCSRSFRDWAICNI